MSNDKTKMMRVDKELHAKLLALIKETGQTVTFVVNQAVREYLKKVIRE